MGHPVDVLVVTVKGDAPQCSRVKLGREEARLEYLIFVADKGRVETRREERVITELARFNNFDSRSEILLAGEGCTVDKYDLPVPIDEDDRDRRVIQRKLEKSMLHILSVSRFWLGVISG